MSVQKILTTVHSFVPTLLALTHVIVILATGLTQTLSPAMVNEARKFLSLNLTNSQIIDINECSEGTSGCIQLCNNTLGSYACYCRSGYRLANDNHQCNGKLSEIESNNCLNEIFSFDAKSFSDIDECSENLDSCEQNCINTTGSYTCSCNVGFSLALDQRSCSGKLHAHIIRSSLKIHKNVIDKLWYFSYQILMSVGMEFQDVIKLVRTLLDHTHATVGLVIVLTGIDILAMVTFQF